MRFKKFSDWVAIREELSPTQVKQDSASEQEVKKITASLVGEPAAKRKSALKALAQKKAMDPKAKPKDIAAIAAAAEEAD